MPTLRPRVMTALDAATDPTVTENTYLAKVIRYIPGETVAAYMAAYNALAAAQGVPLQTVLWIVVAVLTILTPFWILYATADPNKPRPIFQAAIAPVSFLFYVSAIPGNPLSLQSWYQPVYGFLLLILGTFLIPILEKVFVRPSAVVVPQPPSS